MKVYISADIEGVTGITHWNETDKGKGDYGYFAEQMTREVAAACEGALRAGAAEIWVKDAHETGRNIDPEALPEITRLIRGWSGHPFSMVQELDESFDALLFVGYHSWAGSNHNPLAHTMDAHGIQYIKMNGIYASEFMIHAYAAASLDVPVVFISGDKGLMEEAKAMNGSMRTLAVNEGIGDSTISIHPQVAVEQIKKEVELALKGDLALCKIEVPEYFEVEISFAAHKKAYKASFYPGMKQLSANAVSFESHDYFEVLRMMSFVL
ncbi:M55 family metallopeptidase [Anaerosolibacter sp.]|uniref:M55 family metallopeptidase n=1 Tax=Anaerosolibacter sp. TaxID=1872527 RepID=UPI0039EE52D4